MSTMKLQLLGRPTTAVRARGADHGMPYERFAGIVTVLPFADVKVFHHDRGQVVGAITRTWTDREGSLLAEADITDEHVTTCRIALHANMAGSVEFDHHGAQLEAGGIYAYRPVLLTGVLIGAEHPVRPDTFAITMPMHPTSTPEPVPVSSTVRARRSKAPRRPANVLEDMLAGRPQHRPGGRIVSLTRSFGR